MIYAWIGLIVFSLFFISTNKLWDPFVFDKNRYNDYIIYKMRTAQDLYYAKILICKAFWIIPIYCHYKEYHPSGFEDHYTTIAKFKTKEELVQSLTESYEACVKYEKRKSVMSEEVERVTPQKPPTFKFDKEDPIDKEIETIKKQIEKYKHFLIRV